MLGRPLFSKAQSTTLTQSTSLPLVSSIVDSSGEITLGEHAIISRFVLLSKLNAESSIPTTPTSVVARLLFTSDYIDVAEKLLSDLYAVLYCKDGRVLAYHKSFSDFILDQDYSHNFWCNQAMHHRVLANACSRYMKDGLCFNIANIPSSFVLDVDNPMLGDAVEENIPPVLKYSARNWSYHLSAAASIISDGLHDNISNFLQLRALFWIKAMNPGLRGLCVFNASNSA